MTTHAYEPVNTQHPPHDIAAEQATLGGILKLATESTNKAHERLAEVLDIAPPEVFYRSAHQVILTAMTALSDRGEPLDAIAVNKELLARGETSTTGGSVYLHTLVDETPSPASTTYHAKIVADRAILRRLVEVGTRIAQIGYTGEGDVADLVEIARAEVDSITVQGSVNDPHTSTLAEDYPTFLDEMEYGLDEGEGIPYPYADLQKKIGDMIPGQLITVGGGPGQGKTTLGLDLARHAARNGNRVLFHAQEMTRREVQAAILAAEQRIPREKLVFGKVLDLLDDAEKQRYLRHAQEIADLDITVDDSADVTLSRIRAQIGRMERTGGAPNLVVIDYLQLMDKPEAEREDLRVKAVTTELKKIAKERGLVVVLLSQVRQSAGDREDGVPLLSDFADSASPSRDSNVCLMLSTPGKIDPNHPRAGEAILNVAKNRGGMTGRIDLSAQLHLSRFANLG